jgi:hypothetical protein
MTDWLKCMRGGDFVTAWALCDEVLRSRAGSTPYDLARHEQWVWDGCPVAGRRVLVRCYHGLGDTIQFIRYAPLLHAIGSTVIVWAQPALLPLLRTVSGIDELLELHDSAPDVDYDVDVEVMELPHVFRTTLATLPARIPYLHPPVGRQFDDGAVHVGVVWAAGAWDERRSIPYASLAPLREVPGITWHILQRGPPLADRGDEFGLVDSNDSVLATATLIRSLDLVITIDSMPAHLAGALGVPVWTLLQANPDWRWMDGDRSPWYPSMRLFRQSVDGEWASVIEEVTCELREWSRCQPAMVEADRLTR